MSRHLTQRHRMWRRRLIVAIGIVLLLWAVQGRARNETQWGPFLGQVIDADTGKPIAGANVYVEWTRNPPAMHIREDFYAAQEAITDVNGYFTIAAIRPILPVFVGAPGFGFFAPGYAPHEKVVTPPDGRPYIDPTVMKMQKRTRQQECQHPPSPPRSARKAVPKFVQTINEYNSQLKCWEWKE